MPLTYFLNKKNLLFFIGATVIWSCKPKQSVIKPADTTNQSASHSIEREDSIPAVREITTPVSSSATMADTLPDADFSFVFMDLQNHPHSLSSYKGTVIFLNFWATWCGPCLKEIPNIKNLYEKYKDKVTFLLVSNEKNEKVVRFEKSRNTGLPFYVYTMDQMKPTYVHSLIPTTFIISKSGKIIKKVTGSEAWDNETNIALIERLLSEP